MKVGILSSDLVSNKRIFELPIELHKIIYASYEKFGEKNTFLLNPLNFQINFLNGSIEIEYLDEYINIFNELDIILIRRTRGYAKEIYDLIRVLKYLDNKPLILDPIESFDDPLSKISSFLLRLSKNIKQPKTSIVWVDQKDINVKLEFPLLLKPVYGYKGHCVSEIYSKDNIKSHMEKCLKESNEEEVGHAFLLQEKINVKCEYRVLVLNEKSLGCVEKISNKPVKNADQGAKFKRHPFEKVEKLAEKVAKVQKLFFAGVDIVEDINGEFYVLECNRNPQFRSFEEAYLKAGDNIDIAKKLIEEVYSVTLKQKQINLYSLNRTTYDVFISYLKEDIAIAKELKEILAKYGLKVWLDESNVHLTDDGIKESLEMLKKSKLILFLISQVIFNTNKKRGFYRELKKVLDLEKQYGKKISIIVLLQSINIDKLRNLDNNLEVLLNNRIPLSYADKNQIIETLIKEILYLYKNKESHSE